MPLPTEQAILNAIIVFLTPALREIVDNALAGLPEEERASAVAKIEDRILSVIEAKLVPGFLLGLKGAVGELLARGAGPTGSSHGHHAAG